MPLEWWGTAAAIGTFVVILATAIIALWQLGHIRRANQLAGLQSVFETLRDPSIRELLNFIRHDLADKMKDDAFRESVFEIPIDRRVHPEFYVCDIYNHIGSFVRAGLIDEAIYLQTDWYNVVLYWNLLKNVIELGRMSRVDKAKRGNRPYTFENFEWLAARAERWIASHPHGDYPQTEHRMLG